MRVWKFIWLRPLIQAAVFTALIFVVAFIKGSNAQGLAEWLKRTVAVYAGSYLMFVALAAFAWKRAVPVDRKPQ